jgi:aminopeptidase N
MDKKKHLKTIYRQDYAPPAFFIDDISLIFRLETRQTIVTARSTFRARNTLQPHFLRLDGENLQLRTIKIDDTPVAPDRYRLKDGCLEIDAVPDCFSLEVVTEINPNENSELSGLYRSNGNYCTQCEAEGFRRITYFIDRPDILTRFTTRIEARKDECPILLANGNLTDHGEMPDGLHYAVWQDPFPKPCYLFALVAGVLVCIEDVFVTRSGKSVQLRIFVEERNKNKCGHAMRSLKKAMKWDEDVYGLEYDLDLFMIVAVDDFNMGAMENKGLNIFNSKYVLASPDTATDQDYLGIEGVVAHEYFHNWTGNRVTCRDWFQLSLKEGLTVFRDQEFSADMNSRPVQRIDDVNVLRNFQFREDAGPMAHPVRPDSYVEINNFYTATVYNKGAEVIRMIHSLLGPQRFKTGMDLYFQRHDGQAVTCDDFVRAMQDASDVDLDQFKLWYSQSGTPVLQVSELWEEAAHLYHLTIRQSCPATPGQEIKKPFHIPLALGLLDRNGKEIPCELKNGRVENDNSGGMLQLHQEEQTFTFKNIHQRPVLSFLRGFSAPVKVTPFLNQKKLAFLMSHDPDLFNRWDAADRLSTSLILDLIEKMRNRETVSLDEASIQAFQRNLNDGAGDKALIAQALTLPSETYIAQQMEVIDPDLLYQARLFFRKELAEKLHHDFLRVYKENNENETYSITPEAMGRRGLKNICLSYLVLNNDKEALDLCLQQYSSGTNMTDVMAALVELANYPGPERKEAIDDFFLKWKDNPLVVDKWFTLQATSSLSDTLERVKSLLHHPSFSLKNPNRIRSLIGAFCSGNHVRFHDRTGAGYQFLAEQLILIDRTNPQIAARLVAPLINWKKYDSSRQKLMHEQLERLSLLRHVSNDLYEIVKKSM